MSSVIRIDSELLDTEVADEKELAEVEVPGVVAVLELLLEEIV